MANVFVEPLPRGRQDGAAIEGYALELAGGERMDQVDYKTQALAVDAARAAGHKPLVARVGDVPEPVELMS